MRTSRFLILSCDQKVAYILSEPFSLSPQSDISLRLDASDNTHSSVTQASTMSIILMNSSTDMNKGLLFEPMAGIQPMGRSPFGLRININDTSLGITKDLVKISTTSVEMLS